MTPSTPGPHPVIEADHYVPSFLALLNNGMASGASQLYLTHYGIGINEWRILSVLSNTPHCNASHICVTVGMHKAVASRSLREMEAKGLLRIDTSSGQRLMALTPAGQDLHDEVAVIALQREELLLTGLNADQREQLFALLRHMLSNMPAVNAWEPPLLVKARRGQRR